MTPLLGKTLEELQALAEELGQKRFVGKQIANWLYSKHVTAVEAMTNLSAMARQRLAASYEVGCSAPVEAMRSVDGTVKYLYRTSQGHYIESVYIPDGKRATLCVSSQVGCKMGCAFCMTGRQGFNSQLSVSDILNQIYSLPERDTLTNVVFMGQGEPFDNLDNVLRATSVLTAEWGYKWSPKRITVSTVGLAKGLQRFLRESQCHLAVSLHHPIPSDRAAMMPAERAMSIEHVVRELEDYEPFRKRRRGMVGGADMSGQRRLSFEYIVFKNLNDSRQHADALLRLLANLDCRVNLIRFHEIPGSPFCGVDDESMLRFRDYLTQHGLFTTIRASRGQDIYAACGLLTTARQEAEQKEEASMKA